jgi:hypothetical protein
MELMHSGCTCLGTVAGALSLWQVQMSENLKNLERGQGEKDCP